MSFLKNPTLILSPPSARATYSTIMLCFVVLVGCGHPDQDRADVATQPVRPPEAHIQPERVAPEPVLRKITRVPAKAPRMISEHLTVPPQALEELNPLLTEPREEPITVVHYGDSHTRASIIASTMRDRIARDGLVSPGYVQPGHPMRWLAEVNKSGTWHRHNWLYGRDTPSFGPLGLAYSTTKKDFKRKGQPKMTLQLKGKRPDAGIQVTAYYLLENGHMPFRLVSGNQTLIRVGPPKTPLKDPELGEVTVELPNKQSALELVVEGCAECSKSTEFRFFGFQVQYPDAKVEWDALGIGGTTIYSPTRRSDGTMDTYLRGRDADLVMTWFGSNSSVDKGLNMTKYATRFDALLKRLRSNSPNAACLVLGPPDLNRRPASDCLLTRDERKIAGKSRKSSADRKVLRQNRSKRVCNPEGLLDRRGGRMRYPVPEVRNKAQWKKYVASCQHRTLPTIPKLAEVQRDIALKNGCAFFDVYGYMGGAQSMLRWACGSPQLASHDLVHLTPDGYRKVGNAVVDALMSMSHPEPQADASTDIPQP